MAFSKTVSDEEIDIKVHYKYYGEDRCTVITMEVRELMSIGYSGLERIVRGHVQYLGRMSEIRISYKDEQDDYVDLCSYNFNRFMRVLRYAKSVSGIPLTNIRVVEGVSPFPQGKCAQASQGSRRTVLAEDQGTPDACKGLNFGVPSKSIVSIPKDTISMQTQFMENEDCTRNFSDCEADFFETFTYKSPLDHSLDAMKEYINAINIKTVSAKDYLDSLKAKYQNTYNVGRGKQCSNCHLRLDHNSRQCRLEKCGSSEQCGDIQKHPDEKKLIDEADEQLKKLERELKSKNTEYVSLSKAAVTANDSFSQRCRAYLINSNKKKYLLQTRDGLYVPKSSLVNCDLAKLEKFYNRKVPEDLNAASRTFQQIIADFDGEKNVKASYLNPARHLLETNEHCQIKFPRVDHGYSACSQTQSIADACVPPKKRF